MSQCRQHFVTLIFWNSRQKRAYLLSPHFKENRIHSLQKNVKTRGIDNSKKILYIDNAIIDR